MKNIEKVIEDRVYKIELNNLSVIDYISHDNIICECNVCNYKIIDNHRNLSYGKFRCRYCVLMDDSELIRTGAVRLIKIEKSSIHLVCKNGHSYVQDRRNLLSNKGCKECYMKNRIITEKDLLQKIFEVHGDYYKYDMSNYKTLHSKIKISCSENHIFHQKVSNHLQGKGCPICRESLGERTIRLILENENIDYIREKKFDGCVFVRRLPFDFYLPKYNICIEYDGIQHFKPIKQFGGESEFIKTQKKDKIKNEYCSKNNIHLIRISNISDVYKKIEYIKHL